MAIDELAWERTDSAMVIKSSVSVMTTGPPRRSAYTCRGFFDSSLDLSFTTLKPQPQCIIRIIVISIQFNSIQFNSIQFNSIQFNSIQFNSIQLSSSKTISTRSWIKALQLIAQCYAGPTIAPSFYQSDPVACENNCL
jgi:hypothetical protein